MTKARRSSRPASGTGPETSTRCIVSRRSRDAADNTLCDRSRGSVSLLTTVWNTPPDYFEALADSVLSQDADSSFEWVLLDNGSRRCRHQGVARAGGDASVAFAFSVGANLGIIGGMRFCLEHAAQSLHLATVDSRRSPDARLHLRVLSHALGRPAIQPLPTPTKTSSKATASARPISSPRSIPSSSRTRATSRI